MSETVSSSVGETAQSEAPKAGTHRALAPFRHTTYRRLAVALVLSSFASGLWVGRSVVSTAGAVGVLLPALLGGVVADELRRRRFRCGSPA